MNYLEKIRKGEIDPPTLQGTREDVAFGRYTWTNVRAALEIGIKKNLDSREEIKKHHPDHSSISSFDPGFMNFIDKQALKNLKKANEPFTYAGICIEVDG
ncbi:MAG: hypothetical protein JW754_03725 [Candidatus Aenigmarchaeota archaeon]|nr:hypothetical protein [Candidatus Aenigmarchaeota archaeon]